MPEPSGARQNSSSALTGARRAKPPSRGDTEPRDGAAKTLSAPHPHRSDRSSLSPRWKFLPDWALRSRVPRAFVGAPVVLERGTRPCAPCPSAPAVQPRASLPVPRSAPAPRPERAPPFIPPTFGSPPKHGGRLWLSPRGTRASSPPVTAPRHRASPRPVTAGHRASLRITARCHRMLAARRRTASRSSFGSWRGNPSRK